METKKWILKNVKWIILFIAIICFLIIARKVWNNNIIQIDTIGYDIISKALKFNFVTPIAKI